MSSATLLLIQPRRNRYVLRLYKCIVTRTGNFVVHGASCVTGIDFHITLAHVSSQEPLQLDRAAERSSTKWECTHYTKVVRCQLSRFDFGGQLAA